MPDVSRHNQDVVDYYENTRAEYRFIWRNRHNLGLHFGYYDDAHRSHDAAVLNLNAQLAKKAGIGAKDVVLDAGCGVGGSVIWLAQQLGCRCTGVNIDARQVERAKHNAAKRQVADKTHFIEADFSGLPFLNGSFTVFWGVESVVHAQNKQQVLREAYRVLRPGGRLIIAEYLLPDRALSPNEQKVLQRWLDGWKMPCLETQASYRAMLQDAGFTDITFTDWTQHTMPSFERLKSMAKKFKKLVGLAAALRLANRNQLENFSAVEAQMQLLDQGVWRYTAVLARKQ